jgi:RNA-binding protein
MSSENTAKPAGISTRARQHLRSLAHHLEPIVLVGGEGFSDGVCAAIDEALERHELVKVKLQQNFPSPRKEAGRDLAVRLGADLAQVIGRVLVLYRRRKKDDPERPRIVLPT